MIQATSFGNLFKGYNRAIKNLCLAISLHVIDEEHLRNFIDGGQEKTFRSS